MQKNVTELCQTIVSIFFDTNYLTKLKYYFNSLGKWEDILPGKLNVYYIFPITYMVPWGVGFPPVGSNVTAKASALPNDFIF